MHFDNPSQWLCSTPGCPSHPTLPYLWKEHTMPGQAFAIAESTFCLDSVMASLQVKLTKCR